MPPSRAPRRASVWAGRYGDGDDGRGRELRGVLHRHDRPAAGPTVPRHGDLHEAEEVVQEAFARAAVRWPRLRDYDAPEAWVRRMAINLAADRARRLRRQASAILKLSPPPEVPPVSVQALALAEALRTLPVRQRQVIVLHQLVDLPVEEVARTLAMPDGTVKSLLARGRRALAAKLGEPEEVLHPR